MTSQKNYQIVGMNVLEHVVSSKVILDKLNSLIIAETKHKILKT